MQKEQNKTGQEQFPTCLPPKNLTVTESRLVARSLQFHLELAIGPAKERRDGRRSMRALALATAALGGGSCPPATLLPRLVSRTCPVVGC